MEKENHITDSHNIITWLFLTGLLLLRLPLLTGVIFISGREPGWLEPLYQIGTFLLTAILIWWERDRLASYHIDPAAIVIIMLFKPIQTFIPPIWGIDNPLTFPHPLSFSFLIISILLFISLRCTHYKFNRNLGKSLIWFLACAAAGLFLNIFVTIVEIKLLAFPYPPPVVTNALLSPIYQLGYAAIDEEPLFRGFLWGALKRLGLKDLWILLIQAILFVIGYIFFLGTSNALANLIIVFIFSLVAGLLVWKSRTIASSMGLHAFWNGSAFFVHEFLSFFMK
jgi:membrane protease YdiL (CAAX protease family)